MAGTRSLAVAAAVASLSAPTQFLTHVARELVSNDYATAYRSLNPADRKIVPLQTYLRCSLADPIPGRLVSLRVLDAWREPVVVVPGRAPMQSVAVKLAFRLHVPVLPDDVRVVDTRHAILDHGRWTWMLPPTRLGAFTATCGGPAT